LSTNHIEIIYVTLVVFFFKKTTTIKVRYMISM